MLSRSLVALFAVVAGVAASPVSVAPSAVVSIAPSAVANLFKRASWSDTVDEAEEYIALVDAVNSALDNTTGTCFNISNSAATVINTCLDETTVAATRSCICKDETLSAFTSVADCLDIDNPATDFETLCSNSTWVAAVNVSSSSTSSSSAASPSSTSDTSAASTFFIPGLAAALVAGVAAIAL